MGISRATVHKWVRRWRAEGERGLHDRLPVHTRGHRSPGRSRPALAEAMESARAKALVILDGALLPIDRVAADTSYCSGKHKRYGMNVQVLTDPFGRLLLWASPALPGSTHELTAVRSHRIVDALAADEVLGGQGVPRHRSAHPNALPGTPAQALEAAAQQQPRQDPVPR